MKSNYLLLVALFIALTLPAQEQALKITQPDSPKEYLIKENKRVRIQTVDGRKVSGRIQFVGEQAIAVKGETYHLTDIASIKRNPLFLSFLTNGALITGAILTAGFGAIIALSDTSGLLLLIPAAGLIYASIKSPNFNRKFKFNDKWDFEVVPLPDKVSQMPGISNLAVPAQ